MNKFKVLILVIVLCMMPVTLSNAATKQINIKVTTTYKILKGEKLRLYVKGHKNNKKVKWKSSNKKIATVSKKGTVTGKKGGTVKITASIGKRKYKTKVTVFTGEKTVYEHDTNPEAKEDRYDSADFYISDTDNTIQYDEWMTATQLEENGLAFIKLPNSTTLHIIGQGSSTSGIASSYNLTDIPEIPETNKTYGTSLRYTWNGSEFLYNTNDLKTLGLITNY